MPTLCYSLFLPYFIYCIELKHGVCYFAKLLDIVINENGALNLQTKKCDHPSFLFFELRFLKVIDIGDLRTDVVMYKANNSEQTEVVYFV